MPPKALLGSQKWYFPDFPFRGSVGGQRARKGRSGWDGPVPPPESLECNRAARQGNLARQKLASERLFQAWFEGLLLQTPLGQKSHRPSETKLLLNSRAHKP